MDNSPATPTIVLTEVAPWGGAGGSGATIDDPTAFDLVIRPRSGANRHLDTFKRWIRLWFSEEELGVPSPTPVVSVAFDPTADDPGAFIDFDITKPVNLMTGASGALLLHLEIEAGFERYLVIEDRGRLYSGGVLTGIAHFAIAAVSATWLAHGDDAQSFDVVFDHDVEVY